MTERAADAEGKRTPGGAGPGRGLKPALGGLAALALGALGLLVLALHLVSQGAPGPVPIGAAGLALLGLWGALVASGERALGPFGFEEPLVAGIGAGLALGHLPEGVVAGLMLQLVWPGLAPMGGSREPAAGLAAISAVGWLALLPGGLREWRLPFALGAGMVAATWGIAAENLLRRRNEGRIDRLLRTGFPAWRPAALQACRAGLAEAALRGALAVGLLVGVPSVVAVGMAQGYGIWIWSAGPAAAADPWWLLRLPAWGIVPVLFFALGGQARHALAAWTGPAPEVPSETSPPSPPRAGASAAPHPGLKRCLDLMAVQTAFSDRHLQRPGFLVALRAPKGPPDGGGAQAFASLRQAIVEGVAPNTQPIMAAALVGALDRSIAEAERENLPRPLVRLLDVGGPLLAQWGDRVIWGIARPLWAMAALVWAPFSAVAAALVFLGGALIGQAAARLELYRWGWKAGWDLVRGGHSRWWHVAPRWGERLHLPLILGVVGAVVVLWLRVDASTTASALRVAWFIIGGLLGGSVRRPMAWGWICCIAAAVGTALDVWWLPRGLG